LVHGLLGIGRLDVAGRTVAHYFPGIADAMTLAGNRVLIPNLSLTAGVADRAKQLRSFILARSPNEPVHVIAHSMGGLDSRYMISKLGMAERVLSLTTLGTPHRGTAFADWGIKRLERVVRPVLEFVGIPHQSFYDLTTSGCTTFNENVPNSERVRYFSVAAQHDGNFRNLEWYIPYYIVCQKEGDNDGVVSVQSARWGEEMELWDGDHFSLVNWLRPWTPNPEARDVVPRYGKILERLKAEGF